MLQALNKIGQKISSLFGESTESSQFTDCFSGDPLAHLLPWEAYDEENGFFISKNSVGFTIEAVPLVGAIDAVQKEIQSILQEVLEEGDSIQFFLWADHRVQPFLLKWEKARKTSDEIYREIAKGRIKHFLNSSKFATRIFRFFISYSAHSQSDSEKLKSKRERILKTIQSFTYAFSWKVQDFLDTTSALINFSLSKESKKRNWNPYQSLASQLPCGGILKIRENDLCWEMDEDCVCLKTYRAVDFPDFWSLPEMQLLIGDALRDAFQIKESFFLHYGVHCPKQSQQEFNFKKRAHFIEKQGRSGLLLRMIPQLREELKETDLIRKECVQGTKFLWTQFAVGIWAEEHRLIQAEQSLKSLFRINQFNLKENKFLHLPSYLSYLPMTWAEYAQDLHELNLLRTSISKEAAALIPIQGEWMGTSSPGMLFLGRNSQLVNWNPFDNKSGNYNIAIAGRSGSGKSVLMQDLLLNGLATGAKVFVIEVGRSFEKLCNLLNGQYIKFSKDAHICLNPFNNISLNYAEERDTFFSFLKSVLAMMAAPTKGTDDYENALIEKAVRFAWESKKNEATVTDAAFWLLTQQNEKAKILGTMLTPYTKEGVYTRYFEGKSNIDFTSQLAVIELEELKEKKDLQAVVLQLVIMAITNQVFLGDRKTPFYICIDEAWDLLRGSQSGVFIETLARRLRKYNGSLVIGTQSVDDFYATPGALAAFENSDWMCLLAQKASSIRRLGESGKIELNEAKRLALESVHTRHGEYSEALISDADGNYSIARLVLDPFSQLLYTTKAQEYAQIKELQKQGMNLTEAIQYLIKSSNK